ncbi:MAG TPA: hypothetical protein VFC19_08825 [Candidatus Limnocylindrales bacterium]|nr:hypothetical protein [Candidatus Limnocylindrales bacterium]
MSLEDLFSGDPDAPVSSRDRPGFVRVISLLAYSAILTTLIYVSLRALELDVPLPVLMLASTALVGIFRLAGRVRAPLASRHAGRFGARFAEEREHIPDGLMQAIARWDTMMDWSHTDASRFNRKVLPRLAEVVDERLRQRHGVDRAADPLRARAVLGDPLWTFVTTPSRRPPHPRELEQIISALEKL